MPAELNGDIPQAAGARDAEHGNKTGIGAVTLPGSGHRGRVTTAVGQGPI